MKPLLRKCLVAAGLTLSLPVAAHTPVLNCQLDESASNVVCQAGFSDSSTAPNIVMEVYSEDDDMLHAGRTDESSIYTFARPDGIFFIIMDAGPGHVIEISSDEVQGI
ncbi:MAG: hypothetical protein AAF434_03170 [Pseudomonadota bacterium]